MHVLNEFDQNLLSNWFPKKKVAKIANPLNFENLRFEMSKKGGKRNILWVGRLTGEKGAEELIQIIKRVNTLGYAGEINWNIVGKGELEKKLQALKKQ